MRKRRRKERPPLFQMSWIHAETTTMKSSQFQASRRYDFLSRKKPHAMTFRTSSRVKKARKITSATSFTKALKPWSGGSRYWYEARNAEFSAMSTRMKVSNHFHSTKESTRCRKAPFTGKTNSDRQHVWYSFPRTRILGRCPLCALPASTITHR